MDRRQLACIDSFEKFLNERPKEFWTDLETNSDWQQARKLSKECLIVLNKENLDIEAQFDRKIIQNKDGKQSVVEFVIGFRLVEKEKKRNDIKRTDY